jgi:ATP-dependent DNA helicase RecQ
MTMSTQSLLKSIFGYDEFRPLQQAIIDNLLQGRDTLVIMPTGGGKSLCYQLPALIFEGLTVVVSPLISLMQDQVDQLHQLGVAAVYLNSTLSAADYGSTVAQLRAGRVKLLYLAPETLLRPETLHLLDQCRVAMFAIDEAHCISEWGHDFRPEYRQLVGVRRRFPSAVCVALTATATPQVQADIQQALGLRDDSRFISSFDRPNLFLAASFKSNLQQQVLEFIADRQGQSGIIYCGTQKGVDTLHAALGSRGIACLPYHAGLDDATRRRNQTAFIRDDAPIMVATIAFGMGINKPDVRFVLHTDLPKNIESYYQQIGRAGRDGLRADCLLLYSYGDLYTLQHLIQQGAEAEVRERTLRLRAFVRWVESTGCRRRGLLAYFGESDGEERCGNCDNCLRKAQPEVDLTIEAQKFLSCVVRCREQFGVNYIIQVLRGSQAQEISRRGHDRLSTYGIGRDYPVETWKHLAHQFLQQGLLEQDMQIGNLRLTAEGRAVLRGAKFSGLREPPNRVRRVEEAGEASASELEALLLEQLRAKRKELADAANVPPYVIFSDRSLKEMATFLPHSTQAFAGLHGVGQVKIERYAEPFLALIRAYCTTHNLAERPKLQAEAPAPTRSAGARTVEIAQAFLEGATFAQLMETYAIKQSTILNHLHTHVQNGGQLPADRLRAASTLPATEQARVLAAFATHGPDYLRPVYEALAATIPWEELHLLRLVFLMEKQR